MAWAFQSLALVLVLVAAVTQADHAGPGAIAPTNKVRKLLIAIHQPSKGSARAISFSQNTNENNDNDNGNSNGNKNQNQNDNDYNNNNNDDNDYNDNSNSNNKNTNNNNDNDYNDNASNDNDYVSSGSSSSSQNVQSSGSYGASAGSGSAKAALDSNNVASVIRVQEARDTSLKTLYNNYAQTLVSLNFGPDFYIWNPRLNGQNKAWIWDVANRYNVGVPADNAVLQLVNANGKVEGSAYGSPAQENSAYQNNYGSYATLTSLPFGSEDDEEAMVESANSYSISSTQRLVARMLSSCRTVDVDANPYPKQYVTNAQDDERLANCGFGVLQANSSVFQGFYITVTNKGVWAVYQTATFVAKRRIGARERYDSLVDVAIEIDGRTKTVTYYLNGYNVWTIYQAGTLPPADGYTKIDYGETGAETVASLSGVTVFFGTFKCLDESNPWNQNDTVRLVRVRNPQDSDAAGTASAEAYYGKSKFYDEDKTRGNLTWGQGAIMTLYKMKVMRTESSAPRPVVLPGVYGAAANVYQSSNSKNNQNNNNNNDYNNNNNGNSNNNAVYQSSNGNNNNNDDDETW